MPRKAKTAKNTPKEKKPNLRFGIAEWYGTRVDKVSPAQRVILGKTALAHSRPKTYSPDGNPIVPPVCPFLSSFSGETVSCHKRGGVCSFRHYEELADSSVVLRGKQTALCPSRFYEAGTVFKAIGKLVLGTENIGFAKEVRFLTSTVTEKPAGNIDWVMFDRDDKKRWCAIELQAVYFSGKGMEKEFLSFRDNEGETFKFPTEPRGTDFRSSGPKRLMPQLMIKVPTLRRWGKKCAVIVDQEFFAAMGNITQANHISNADIVWFVVSYGEDGRLQVLESDIRYSTLEASIEGLTGGVAVPLPEFEAVLSLKPSMSPAQLTATVGDDGSQPSGPSE